ncbi:uncharacterized protein ND-B15 [Venturia canescens]|uniref:uncharacterized protein ND-B15 n=1 Tax=Venturia canescens TaxID=32260 RepID=UPI001C9BCC00|nr:uncharacterized protein LOC122416981 [Venturia canescens]
MSTPQETYDVTPTQKKIMLARAARRNILRHKYLEEVGNPYRPASEGGALFDSGLQRLHSMVVTQSEFFRPNWKTGLYYMGVVVLPIAIMTFWIVGDKDKQEHRYRTGQVSYRDREFKFK